MSDGRCGKLMFVRLTNQHDRVDSILHSVILSLSALHAIVPSSVSQKVKAKDAVLNTS